MERLNRAMQLKIIGGDKIPNLYPRYALLSGNKIVTFGVFELRQAATTALHAFSREACVLKDLAPVLVNLETGEITNG